MRIHLTDVPLFFSSNDDPTITEKLALLPHTNTSVRTLRTGRGIPVTLEELGKNLSGSYTFKEQYEDKMDFNHKMREAKYKLATINNILKCCYISGDSTKMFLDSDKPKFVEMSFLNF